MENLLKDFCFVGSKFQIEYDDLFEDDDILVPIEPEWNTMAHIMHNIGAFKSVSEARKNGWDKKIPLGWNEIKLSKRFNGRKLYIWNPEFTYEEWKENE